MNLEEKYKAVAQILAQNAPSGWKVAWADVEVNDNHTRQTYDYISGDDQENWFDIKSADDRDTIYFNLRDVRDFMAEQTGDKWKKVRFTLNADGTFKTKFEYED